MLLLRRGLLPFFKTQAKEMGLDGSVAALFQKWEIENHELSQIINAALLTVPNRAVGGKTFTDALSTVADGESFQQTIANHLKSFFLADAKALHAVGVSHKIAEREAIRIDDKAHANSHFWLTTLPCLNPPSRGSFSSRRTQACTARTRRVLGCRRHF